MKSFLFFLYLGILSVVNSQSLRSISDSLNSIIGNGTNAVSSLLDFTGIFSPLDISSRLLVGRRAIKNSGISPISQFLMSTDELLSDILKSIGLGDALVIRLHNIDVDIIQCLSQIQCKLLAASMERLQDIMFVEPDAMFSSADYPVNDDKFREQWGLMGKFGINAQNAWELLSTKNIQPNASVTVGLLDSGVYLPHPDLKGRIWRNLGEIESNNVDDDRNGFVDDVNGYNFLSGDSVVDDFGHGTHCAGIIAANTNNSIGVSGVAGPYPNIKVAALKCLDHAGNGSASAFVSALNYATSHKFPIVSASLTSEKDMQAVRTAIQSYGKTGGILICASGNNGRNIDNKPIYPAAYTPDMPYIVSVGATNIYGEKATFSNFGTRNVDIFAPGDGILSTVCNPSSASEKYICKTAGYRDKSGTSMACPFVSGVAAVVKLFYPTITASQLKALLITSTQTAKLQKFETKSGLLDFEKILKTINQLNGDYTSLDSLLQTYHLSTPYSTNTGFSFIPFLNNLNTGLTNLLLPNLNVFNLFGSEITESHNHNFEEFDDGNIRPIQTEMLRENKKKIGVEFMNDYFSNILESIFSK